ncbi:MAG: hypothetical protein Q9217_001000 [Psora testacea]
MPSSPRTPTRRRKSSTKSIDLSCKFWNPQSNDCSTRKPSSSRRSSLYSIHTSTTPRPHPSHDRNGEFLAANGFGDMGGPGRGETDGNNLGNLADELAEAWDDYAEGEEVSPVPVEGPGATEDVTANGEPNKELHDLKVRTPPPPVTKSAPNMSLNPPKVSQGSKHRWQPSQYDGSEYGDDSDFDNADGMAPLEARMATIEGLTRRDTEANGSNTDNVVQRVADSLKDLPSQSGVENGTSRLITTHTALTSHLTNQSRSLTALTHHLISPLSISPDLEVIEELVPLLATLIVSLPTPTTHCFSSLHSLRSSTTDLQSTLIYLSDTIYMTRQTLTFATRKLRSALDMVVEMRREAEAREEAVRWIEKGDWDQRLAGRECARVCGDVVGGFEEVCNGWRKRLVGEIGAA